MKYFVTVEEVFEFTKVRFYSIKVANLLGDAPEYSEFEKFLLKFRNAENEDVKEEFEDIIAIIEHIGDNSADMKYFRFENMAVGLPSPKNTKIEMVDIKVNSKLRLYCVLIDESNVILCNGGWKTKDQAQNCPNVAPHFDFANKLAKYIIQNRNDFGIGTKHMLMGEENGFYL